MVTTRSRNFALPVLWHAGVAQAAAAPALLLQNDRYEPTPEELQELLRNAWVFIVILLLIGLVSLAVYIWMIVDAANRYGAVAAILVAVAGFFFFLITLIIYLIVRASTAPSVEHYRREREPAYPGMGTAAAPGFPVRRGPPQPEAEPADLTLSDAERDPQLDEIIAASDWRRAEAFAQEMLKTARGFKDDKGVARYARYLARICKRLR